MGLTQRAYSIGHSASVHEIKKPFYFEIGSSIISWPWFIQRKKNTYRCDICYATFSFKNNLTKHQVSIHEGKKPIIFYLMNITFDLKI